MLLEHLKKDHIEIVDMLSQVKSLGIVSQEGKQKLFAAKNLLLNHLKKEDQELYPFLRKEAEKDSDLHSTLEIFARDMDSISTKALSFFEKYSKDSNTIEFAIDFGNLVAILTNRIRQEENVIYAEYEKRSKS